LGHQVITLEHVEEVIARVGKPADFAESEDREEEKQGSESEAVKGKKRLYRNTDDKLIGGVCSGIAAYFGWSVVALRIILILAPFVISGAIFPLQFNSPGLHFQFNLPGLIIIAYLILWAIVPAARTVDQKLQMQGKPVTPENIGKTVAAESASDAYKQQKGCLAGFVEIFVTLLKVGVAGLGCLIGLPLLFALIIVLIVLFAVLFGAGGGLMGMLPAFLVVNHPVLATITGILLLGIPVFAIIYSIIAHFAKIKPLHQSVKWGFLLIWIVAFILFFFSGFRIDGKKWANNSWGVHAIVGNGVPSQKTFDLEDTFTCLEIGDNLMANIQIEQIPYNVQPSIEISGDANLVELVRYNLHGERLTLSATNRFRSKSNLTIKLNTNDLRSIQAGFVGNIRMNNAFTGDELDIRMRGVGNFRADSLYVHSLTVRTEGVGSATLSGKAEQTTLETRGAGSINAMELVSDTVYAQVAGVGSIQCDPVEYLEGRLQGVGTITYKEEPKNKNVSSSGIGSIKRR
jgi:phage shock protein PspC (stress-responsive transcriptional regulator)